MKYSIARYKNVAILAIRDRERVRYLVLYRLIRIPQEVGWIVDPAKMSESFLKGVYRKFIDKIENERSRLSISIYLSDNLNYIVFAFGVAHSVDKVALELTKAIVEALKALLDNQFLNR